MVESEAKELSEDQMLGAVLFGHDEQQIGPLGLGCRPWRQHARGHRAARFQEPPS